MSDTVFQENKKLANLQIDGVTFSHYLKYSALDVKSYFKEPVRSTSGVIENLDSYATFITPQVAIEFKYMPIEDYRKLMQVIYSKNEHIVKYYDIVFDKFVTKKMYFKPEQLPDVFAKSYEVLAIINYKLELVGTNADIDLINITYHLNPPKGYTGPIKDESKASNDFPSNDYFKVGQGAVLANGQKMQSQKFPVNYVYQIFKNWNTLSDGSGFPYEDNQEYYILQSSTTNGTLHLYAQWQ